MNIFVGCEHTGLVSEAFAALGHTVISCDLKPGQRIYNRQHIQGDLFEVFNSLTIKFDLGIFFPPCTYICRANSNIVKDDEGLKKHLEALEFVEKIWALRIDKICIENPIGYLSSKWMRPDQITSFNYFGDPYKKDICLWLRGLPALKPTEIVEGTKKVQNRVNSTMSRELKSEIKSMWFPGIANAMAAQWGR